MQAILCEVLFEFESQNVGSVYSQQQKKRYGWQVYCWNPKHPRKRKVWNIDVEREYRKLSYLFQNPERNNGIITESLRQLNMFIHQQSTTIMSSHASAKLTPLVDSLWIPSQKVDSLY